MIGLKDRDLYDPSYGIQYGENSVSKFLDADYD